MVVIQEKSGNKHIFTFSEDSLNFAYEDKSGSGDTDIQYAEFQKKSSIRIEQNDWLRNAGLLWILIGAFSVGAGLMANNFDLGDFFWLALGAGCVIVAIVRRVKYSVYNTNSGNVFVIQDKEHDKIISEIFKRKKEQLLTWHGDINHEEEPSREISKFKWLVEQGVLSEAEANKQIAVIESSIAESTETKSIHRIN